MIIWTTVHILIAGPGNSQPISSPFAAPDMMAKLLANPKTRKYLNQPDYCQMIEKLKENPNDLKYERQICYIGMLLGILVFMSSIK